jgi:hypothetical protein
VATILAGACIGEHVATRVGQAQRVIQLAVGQQPDIGGDRGAAKLEHQPAVKIEPQRLAARSTRRVRHCCPVRSPTSRNGVYLVEDLRTTYWGEYEGGLKRRGSFIETCKDLIDELNADHTRGAVEPTPRTHSTLSMHFYDSIVVFEKGRHTVKWAPDWKKTL